MTEGGDGDNKAGYRSPPVKTRFRKGQSGNPRGRPKGRRNQPPYEAVLGQMATIREGGVDRRVTASEAFLLLMVKRGFEGDGASVRLVMAATELAKASGLTGNEFNISAIVRVIVASGSVTSALEPLRMARKVDRYRDTAKMMLEPWLVKKALARLGDRRLTIEQQKQVIGATRTPWKVPWPEWWESLPSSLAPAAGQAKA